MANTLNALFRYNRSDRYVRAVTAYAVHLFVVAFFSGISAPRGVAATMRASAFRTPRTSSSVSMRSAETRTPS